MKILHVDSAITQSHSVSRPLTQLVVSELLSAHPAATVQYRDLATDPLPHATLETLDNALAGTVLREFLEADVVVLGAPMYNLSIPSQLKSWLDVIMKAGVTFKYTDQGPVGLVSGKRVIVVSSRGGIYTEDFHEQYLRATLEFIGISDIQIVRAQGVAYSPQHRQDAVDHATQAIEKLSAVAQAA